MVALGRRFYEAIVARLPTLLAPDALDQAVKRLKLPDSDRLMEEIARGKLTDLQVMEALMPGSAGELAARPRQPDPGAISMKGLTPGVAFTLAPCCTPVPGDRIVGVRGGVARLQVIVRNQPGTLGVMAGILGSQHANIVNLTLSQRDESFHTYDVLIEVQDVSHLMRILAALRAAEAVASAERTEPKAPPLAA
jgi:guanosine-3',5'-bis(diphosphate) 3'-pyrophosphohydrolase